MISFYSSHCFFLPFAERRAKYNFQRSDQAFVVATIEQEDVVNLISMGRTVPTQFIPSNVFPVVNGRCIGRGGSHIGVFKCLDDLTVDVQFNSGGRKQRVIDGDAALANLGPIGAQVDDQPLVIDRNLLTFRKVEFLPNGDKKGIAKRIIANRANKPINM